MIAASPTIGYIHEPFGLRHRPGVCRARFDVWFPYVSSADGARYEPALRDTLAFRYSIGAELRAVRSPRDLARAARDAARFGSMRRRRLRPLVKDPVALFSAPWLAETFDMQVVLLVRHPAAFAASVTSSGWRFPFDHFLRQPRLMADLLEPFRSEIEQFAATERDIIDQAVLLWLLTNHAVVEYTSRHPGWLLVRHEDLALDAVARFRELYERLEVPFGPTEQAVIQARSDAGTVSAWRTRLTPEEIERVRTATERAASAFYSDRDWESRSG